MGNKTFTVGQKLETRSSCDHNCIYLAEVIKRTNNFITLKIDGDKDYSRVGIHNRGDGEFCFPFGRYSMAPIFRA